MKRITAYALFGAMFAIAVGTLGVSHISATTFGLAGDLPTTSDTTKIQGHITLVATDPDGHIKAYRQTDNIVVNRGADCVTRLLFGGNSVGRGAGSGTGNCIGTLTAPWTTIAIGTTATAEAATDKALGSEILSGTDAGLARAVGTVTYTNATTGTSVAVITNQFTASTSQTVAESGLFNGTTVSTAGMFAHKAFTGIALVSGDKLTVTWTVNTS